MTFGDGSSMARRRIGVWLIGARGGVATTTILGHAALRRKWVGDTGLVTQLPRFAPLSLAGWDELTFGGHDIRDTTIAETARELATVSRALDADLVRRCHADLARADRNVRPGTICNVGERIGQLASAELRRSFEHPREAIRRIQHDLQSFVAKHRLQRLIMVNLASTEPTMASEQLPLRWADLNRLIDRTGKKQVPLGSSSLYAIAALDLGFPYINFTPSTGSALAAVDDLARQRETCHMGRDGKTGETLLKSVLAPMFACRNLQVMSWVGHNIFGNMDGLVLDDPANKASKVRSKDRLLGQILSEPPQTLVSIEYIQSLGDWKTAWDHIHFRGFLGTPMILQFIWQGCDSLLAAPLVLDLVRLTEFAHRQGERGELRFLASFFKSPQGVEQHDFMGQFQLLDDWLGEMNEKTLKSTKTS